MSTWDILGDREHFANDIVRLHFERIRTPEGEEADWTVVDIPDGACVLPIENDGSTWMIRQFRHTARRDLWEFPAGRLEEGESPQQAAARELREEAGLAASEWIDLGPVWPLDGVVRHRIHHFIARDLKPTETAHETFEKISVHRLPAGRLQEMVASGELDDGVALAIAARAMAKGLLTLLLLLLPITFAAAQGTSKAPSRLDDVAVLQWHASPNDAKALRGFERGWRALGRTRPRVLDARGDEARAKTLLSQLNKKSVLITLGTRATRMARRYRPEQTVVFTAVTHPVLAGFAPNWKGSKTHVAGNSNWLDRGEMLRSFRLAVPQLKRLGVLSSFGNEVSAAEIDEARRAAKKMKELHVVSRVLKDPKKDLPVALKEMMNKVDALWIPIDFTLYQDEPLQLIAKAAQAQRIPIVSSSERCAGKGALAVVAVDYELLGLRAAAIAKRVIAGEDPGGIAIGRLSSSRLYVDVSAAKAIGLEPPLPLILRAWQILGRPRR